MVAPHARAQAIPGWAQNRKVSFLKNALSIRSEIFFARRLLRTPGPKPSQGRPGWAPKWSDRFPNGARSIMPNILLRTVLLRTLGPEPSRDRPGWAHAGPDGKGQGWRGGQGQVRRVVGSGSGLRRLAAPKEKRARRGTSPGPRQIFQEKVSVVPLQYQSVLADANIKPPWRNGPPLRPRQGPLP